MFDFSLLLSGSVPLFYYLLRTGIYTTQKKKFSIKDFFSKCDQIRSFLRIWSHLLNKSLMTIFIFVQCYLIVLHNVKNIVETFLKSCQTFIMKLFAKIVNFYKKQSNVFTKTFIVDLLQGPKYTSV